MARPGNVGSAPPPGLDGGAQGRRPEPDTVRRALRWYLLWNMVAFVGVAVGALVLSWLVVRSEAQRDAEVAAKAIAHSIVGPLANDDFHAGDPAALARMGQVMENRARDGSIAHIKVWGDAGNGNGTVLWSDLEPLIGQTFELEEEEYEVFGTKHTVSDISNLEKVENKLERGDGQLIEVYTGTQDASGAPILLEIYLSTAALPTEMRARIREILPLPILALIALSLATLPLAVSLAHRVDRGQRAHAAAAGQRRRVLRPRAPPRRAGPARRRGAGPRGDRLLAGVGGPAAARGSRAAAAPGAHRRDPAPRRRRAAHPDGRHLPAGPGDARAWPGRFATSVSGRTSRPASSASRSTGRWARTP